MLLQSTEMSLMSASACLAYIVVVNVITAIWLYIGHVKSLSFQTLVLAMYLPTVVALCFTDDIGELLTRILGLEKFGILYFITLCPLVMEMEESEVNKKFVPVMIYVAMLVMISCGAICFVTCNNISKDMTSKHKPLESVVYSAVAVYGVAALVGACIVLDLWMGWAQIDRERGGCAIHPHNKGFIRGFLRAAGEETGWSGVAWGLFHVPVLVLMTSRLSPPKPRLTVVVQCLAVLVSAFPHGWVAVKSGYSVWACGLMHGVWNQVNPKMLGSIYTQAPGAVTGQQWLINGEGLAGIIVTLPVALWISFSF